MSIPIEGIVATMPEATEPNRAPESRLSDEETWLTPLSSTGHAHDDAVRRLHELLVRASTHEVRRRAARMGHSQSSELEDLAMQSADDALIAILARIDSFERRSAFTTWAYKFAIHTAGVAVRKLVWREREIPSSDTAFDQLASTFPDPAAAAEQRELMTQISAAIKHLTPRQREVLLALCVTGVPIDVLADRLGSTRGAVYKTLHDARNAIRKRLGSGASQPTIVSNTIEGTYRG